MENFSQESDEKELEQTDSKSSDVDDIQFEETIDIDKLQAELQNKIDKGDAQEQSLQAEDSIKSELEFENTNFPETPLRKESTVEFDANDKKYVIYINSENIDYMENLSTNERKILINKILKEQNELTIKQKEAERIKRFTINMVIITLTIIIAFPILFMVVNKGLDITMDNYRQARDNFTKLYKQKGKIRQGNPNPEDIKY